MKPRKQIEVYKGRGGFYWRARDKNGQVVADGSEPYVTKSNARRAARRIGLSLMTATIVEIDNYV